jgi:hypothetical protein
MVALLGVEERASALAVMLPARLDAYTLVFFMFR